MPGRDLHIASVRRGPPITVSVDGWPQTAYAGETIAGVLLRNGPQAMRRTLKGAEPRSYFCGMGSCQECIVTVDGRMVQGCITLVADGMNIVTGVEPGDGGRR